MAQVYRLEQKLVEATQGNASVSESIHNYRQFGMRLMMQSHYLIILVTSALVKNTH